MMLKQSTSAVVLVGPVLDSSGAAVTTAVIGDFSITKNGTTAAMSGNTISHVNNGHYAITLTTTNTDTIGRLSIHVNNTAMAMPVFRWDVLAAIAVDALQTGILAANSITAAALATDAGTEIGAAVLSALGTGTWASAIPWNASWDAEVQSECADALTAFGASTVTTAQVNAEVLDVLQTDTFAELAAVPAATSSLKDKLTWLFQWARNKSTQTSTQRKLYADDASTVISTETVSDDGTTYTKGEAS